MVTETAIRLLVVDDHAMFREGLVRMLEKEPEFSVVGQAGSAADALRVLRRGQSRRWCCSTWISGRNAPSIRAGRAQDRLRGAMCLP